MRSLRCGALLGIALALAAVSARAPAPQSEGPPVMIKTVEWAPAELPVVQAMASVRHDSIALEAVIMVKVDSARGVDSGGAAVVPLLAVAERFDSMDTERTWRGSPERMRHDSLGAGLANSTSLSRRGTVLRV